MSYPNQTPAYGFNPNDPLLPSQPGPSFPGYPPQQPGYPPQQPGYPPQQPGYPPSEPGYPPQQPGYPPQQPGYPPQQPGYPPQQPGYPPQQPGYLPQQPGYLPQQPGYPPQQPGYPPQQPGYPPSEPVVNQPGQPTQPAFPQFPGQPGGSNPGGMMPPKMHDDDVMLSIRDGENDEVNPFSDASIRRAFIRKVYLILTAQLLVTFGFVFVCILDDVKHWIIRHKEVYYTSYGVFIVTYFMLACPCCKAIRRKWPWNFICLSLLTLAMAYMTGTITAFYQTKIVLIALGITAGVCLTISIFAIQTKIDFTLCRGCLCVFSMIFMVFGIACLIIGIKYGFNETLDLVYSCIGALMFSMYLLVDTQMIVGGKNRKHQISPEEYIYAALQLYIDMVQLFLMILRIVGSKKVSG